MSNLNQPSIHNLSIRKKSQTTYFQSKIIKLNSDISSKFVYKHLNNCIDRGKFPNELKHYELVPVHKKTVNLTIKTLDLQVYVLVSLKCMEEFYTANSIMIFENILFPSQCSFRKSYSLQHCLLVVTEIINLLIEGTTKLKKQ